MVSGNVSSIAQQYLYNLVQFIFYLFYNPTSELEGSGNLLQISDIRDQEHGTCVL